jgi:hypothetical protein
MRASLNPVQLAFLPFSVPASTVSGGSNSRLDSGDEHQLAAHPPRSDASRRDLAVCRPEIEWQVLAALPDVREGGSGPLVGASRPCAWRGRDICLSSQLNLLRDAERVIDLDAEITDRAFELRVPEEQLDGSQVAGLLVDLGRLRSPHRMRAIGGAVEPGALDPGMDDPRILPGRQVRLRPEAAREEVLSFVGFDLRKLGTARCSGLFGNFELDRSAGLLLNDGCAVSDTAAGADTVDL